MLMGIYRRHSPVKQAVRADDPAQITEYLCFICNGSNYMAD
jgi:hypothetical protein